MNSSQIDIPQLKVVKGKPVKHAAMEKTIHSGRSYVLAVEVRGRLITGFVNHETVLQFDAQRAVEGYVGLWTKADSKVYFDALTLEQGDQKRMAAC